MKKFYYSKEALQDESLLGLNLRHHKTMNINKEQGRNMSTRAASVNSLDLLSEAPTIPRVKSRDVTRSQSDILTKTQSNAQKLVTETELSSSWLYKTMQASINARFKSPRKSPSVHKTGDLEQFFLQDSELKPIPVKSKAAKTSSCICHFATMMTITLCTIGFLVSIAAIIYMEVFADRNITSLHTTEAEVDLSDVIVDTREAYNLTTHTIEGEKRVLNEARIHIFDGDEEILNDVLKSSTTDDLPILLNKSNIHGKLSDSVIDDGKPEMFGVNQNANVKKIKLQDDSTVVYEKKSEDSTEYEVGPNFIHDFKRRSFGIDSLETENNSEDNSEKPIENTLKESSEKELGSNTESENAASNDSLLLENTEGTDEELPDFKLNEIRLKDGLEETVSEDVFNLKDILGNVKLSVLEENKSIERIFQDVNVSSEKLNSSEIFQSRGPNPDINDIFSSNDNINFPNTSQNNGGRVQISEDSDVVLTNLLDPETIQNEDSRSALKVDQTVQNEYDVNTMLVTVDDTEVSTVSFISKRNGESNLFQVSSAIPSVKPVKQIDTNSFVSPKKPVDIKVSLAEAMKHLQNIDVNNRLITSRTKPKQKVQKPKRKTVSNKDQERKRYLQHMRLMLLKQQMQ